VNPYFTISFRKLFEYKRYYLLKRWVYVLAEDNILRVGAYRETIRTLKERKARLLKKIGEMESRCPVCGRHGLKIEDYLYDMPLIGEIILSTGKCNYCGYRYNDVRIVEAKSPQRIIYKAEGPDDLNALVVRASTATIKIPELGGEIKPGPMAQGYITTIEGVLHMFKDIAEFLCSSSEINEKACKEKLKWLDDAINGKVKFTLVIEDPEGVSMVISRRKKPLIESLEKTS